MSGPVFAILSAFSFSANAIFVRRAVIKVSNAATGVFISVPLGTVFILIVLIARGEAGSLRSFSWQSYLWLTAAGIVHFVVGRSLSYSCVKVVGANLANVIRKISLLITVSLGITVLGEPVSWKLVLGVTLILFGIIVAGLNPQMFRRGQGLFSDIPRIGYLYGLGNGVAWGISPILVKMGLRGSGGAPMAGAFISFLAATIALTLSLLLQRRRLALSAMTARTFVLFSLASMLSGLANLFRYVALGMAPASVVSPLANIQPVFLLILSFLFNRNLEIFNIFVISGTVATVAGSILLL